MRLQKLFISIRSSLWFVPALAILASIALATGLVEADRHVGKTLEQWWPRLFLSDAEAARLMLSTIAGSIATIAGVAFSITIVALVLASTQYSPRVLRNYMRDRATQLVLGIFVGVYIYCLLVMRSLIGNGAFVAPLSVLGGLILAVVSVGCFIFFIHHISASIQPAVIAAAITRETLEVVEHLFPDKCSGEENEKLPAIFAHRDWQMVPASGMGYIQTIDVAGLRVFAREHKIVVRMECGPGDFVAPCSPLLSFTGQGEFTETVVEAMGRFYALGTYRTIEQDPGFGIRQLVDISLKALSPSINDTTTAVTCIEHLSVILMRIAQRQIPSPFHYEQGEVRVITKATCFEQLVALSFHQILENAEGNTKILTTLLNAAAQVASVTPLQTKKAIMGRWVESIREVGLRSARFGHAMDELNRHVCRAETAVVRAD